MILDAVLSWLGGIVHGLLSVLPVVPVPGWINGLSGAMSSVFGTVSSMGVWFPGGLALSIILAVLAVWLVGLLINVARMVISLFTGGGGSV